MKFITPIIFIGIAIALFFFVANPYWSEIKGLRADVSAYNTALTNSTQLQKTRDDLVAQFNAISPENKDRLSRFLPNTVDNIELILEIQQMANNDGVVLKNITFQPPVKEAPATPSTLSPTENLPYGIFDLEFKAQAKYAVMMAFLKDIEQNLRIVDISAISVSVPPPNKDITIDPNVYDYDIKIKTYWLKH